MDRKEERLNIKKFKTEFTQKHFIDHNIPTKLRNFTDGNQF